MESWIYPVAGIGNWDTVLTKSSSTSWNDGYGMIYLSGKIRFYVNHYSGGSVEQSIPLDQWSHVVGTYDGSSARLYLNGELVATRRMDTPINHSTAPLRIGQGVGSNSTWPGKLDEVAIYDRALSLEQIRLHHRRPPAIRVNVELVDEATGTTALVIASGLRAPGVLNWTIPNSVTADREYRIRVTAVDGSGPSDLSNETFQIANDGTEYFVNIPVDGDLGDNEYTTAAGSNLNTGKSADAPMSTLRALVQAYDLDPGDVVKVDTGDYVLLRNVVLTAEDRGVRILGAQDSANDTRFDRKNTVGGSYGVELLDADDVTIDSLSITGGYYGIFAGTTSYSDDVTIQNGRVFDNVRQEVWLRTSNNGATLASNEVFDTVSSQYNGIQLEGDQVTVTGNVVHGHRDGIALTGRKSQTIGNEVFDNARKGIYFSVSNDTGSTIAGNSVFGNQDGIAVWASNASPALQVRGNEVFDNTRDGIYAAYNAQVTSNTVFGNTRYGIFAQRNAAVVGNTVHGQQYGIVLGARYDSASAKNNRVYDNSNTGIFAYYRSRVDGNAVYANPVGVRGAQNGGRFGGDIINNLLYSNTNQGILLTNAGAGAEVVNNTIFQPVGDAVRVQSSSSNVLLRNNILWVDSGFDIFADANSLTGFNSDYNLFHQGADPNAFVGFWGGTNADMLADWQTLSSQDANGLEGDPLFIDIDGADNVLGYDPTGDGFDGGPDDNFILRKNSPAIDVGHSWSAPVYDLQGSPRLDDLGTINQGSPEYYQATVANTAFPSRPGVAKNWRSTDYYWNYNLPITFPFYGVDYTSVYVTTNGLLQFATTSSVYDGSNSLDELTSLIRIAPLWDNLRTNGTNDDGTDDDIYIDESLSDRVTIRWDATNEADGSDVNFAVTLFVTGAVQFHYGPANSDNSNNSNLTPTVGISAGDGRAYQLTSYDGQSELGGVSSIEFSLAPGMVDMGAYEFRGDSRDEDPPVVTGTVPSFVHAGGSTTAGVDTIQVLFSEELNNIDAN
ncbi:MAG: right-handed parallel beta-helix repeat-containing protein, partial [Pirellulaceae bacterium]